MSNEAVYKAFLMKKVSSRREYFAFFLSQYQRYENLTDQELQSFLGCSDENLFRLALCHVPDMQAETFRERINKIAEFTGILVPKLIKILRQVAALDTMQNAVDEYEETGLLLAARQRSDDTDEPEEKDVTP